MIESRSCAITSQYNLPLHRCTFSNVVQFGYPVKVEAFFLVPLVINIIYDTFTAFKIPTAKVSFSDLETDTSEGAKSGDYRE